MEISFLTIAELGEAYRKGETSPVASTRALLDRVEAHDGALHSFIRVTPEVALAQAEAAEREMAAGKRRGPLHGIPYALKDIIETAGIVTTGHSKIRQDYVPKEDAEVARRLKAAGAVLVGKLATWEFSHGGPSFDLPWPPARNPWNTDCLPGGSSSGAGAAVAAGLVPFAIGTDTGGSVRGPAAFCGLAGLKPSYGRVSRRGVFSNTFTMDHCGPLTRSAEDVAAVMAAIAGHDPEDPSTEDLPVPDYLAELGGGIRGLRIGLVEGWHDGPGAHPELGGAIDAALGVLEGLGARIERVKLSGLREYTDCKSIISAVEHFAIHAEEFRTRPQDFGRIFRNRVLPGAIIRGEDYVQALRWRTVLAREQAAALKQVDAFVTAASLGVADRANPDAVAADRFAFGLSITQPFSISGVPALAVPCGFTRAEGLPLSLQIAAGPMQDALVLRIAHAYQQATDWHRRHPVLG
jgi:aspartyl-tRNA(Asn)/glutamyl-tRNA(Gln) amidotransferase subunit A